MRPAALKRRAREARAWLMDACFPLWSETGHDGQLFLEVLDMQHRQLATAQTRVRVQARQAYVYASARQMGWSPDRADDLMAGSLYVLSSLARRPDGLIGRTLNSDGSGLHDDTPDLYDAAFTLMALAHMAMALEDGRQPLELAREILAAIGSQMKDTSHGGYHEWLPAPDGHYQNPHMHMLEACLALHAADPSGGHDRLAGEILSLFQTRLTAGRPGIVAECFKTDWTVDEAASGKAFEPGHQFEWVWLLTRQAQYMQAYPPPEAGRLYDYAVATCDADGRAPNLTDRKGRIVSGARRTWPQTEALKAHLAMIETRSVPEDAERAIASFDVLMDEFLTPEGGWLDRHSEDGQLLSDDMPASTGYHVVLAFTELMRICDA